MITMDNTSIYWYHASPLPDVDLCDESDCSKPGNTYWGFDWDAELLIGPIELGPKAPRLHGPQPPVPITSTGEEIPF